MVDNKHLTQQKISNDSNDVLKQENMDVYTDRLKDIKNDIGDLVSEIRKHMNKIYTLDYLIQQANMLEDKFIEIEKDFIKEFKTEKVE